VALRTNRLNAQGYIGGTAVGGAQARSVKRLDLLRNLYADNSNAIDNKSGAPNGYTRGAILMPLKAGGMSSYNFAQLVITASSADAKMGKALAGSSAMALTLVTADLDQIVALLASGTLAITVDQANLSAGVLMAASASGAITVDLAQLGGIIPMGAAGNLVITPDVTMTALANMIAEAGGPTPLSPEGLAAAVWSALLADYADTGTMGAALADAGGAGNPWAALLASNQDPGSFGEHIQKLLKTTTYLGTK
jgi:prolyl-tRNA editing enzyme YbaK/EbsC (Cys-tRNA(Pro) deacylase)